MMIRQIIPMGEEEEEEEKKEDEDEEEEENRRALCRAGKTGGAALRHGKDGNDGGWGRMSNGTL